MSICQRAVAFAGQRTRILNRTRAHNVAGRLIRMLTGLLTLAGGTSFALHAQQIVQLNGAPSIVLTPFVVSPVELPLGATTFTVYGLGFNNSTVVTLNGASTVTKPVAPFTLSVTATIPISPSGTISMTVSTGGRTLGTVAVPVTPAPVSPTSPPVTMDAAARFTMQAAFGPRYDVVSHIESVGFNKFLDEQFAQDPIVIPEPLPYSERTYWLQSAATGNALLRQRVSLALQDFIVSEGMYIHGQYVWWEHTLEQDAFGNARQLLTDISSDCSMGDFLNIAGNVAPSDPTQHPNQNFGREVMQLFTLGPYLLNDDGSYQTDSNGNPIATYDQNTVLDMSRVFTGWNFGPTIRPAYFFFGKDYSSPLVATESQHDHGQKILFGNVTLPAGQTAAEDRSAALDAIFNHPNMPPFFSKMLIQRLVTSNPSPAYVARISAVFKNDGNNVRGNLAAVIRAILLDPEARAGDSGSGNSNDGFLQEPILFQTFTMSVLQDPGTDDEISYWPAALGQDMWMPTSVFGDMSPTNTIPGTTIVSPEFGLHNNLSLVLRSEMLWGIITGAPGGWTYPNYNAWIYTHSNTIPGLVDDLNHLLYHGQMTTVMQQEILATCTPIAATNLLYAKQIAIFLAMNGDGYTVAH
jgi:hypothetical protein